MQLKYYCPTDFSGLETLLKKAGVYYEPLDREDIIRKKIEYDPSSIIIAQESGQIIGTVFIIYDPWLSFVYHLGVHPQHRGKGAADSLMNEAEKILSERGVRIATLFIEEGNEKSIDFYKRRAWNVMYKCTNMEKILNF